MNVEGLDQLLSFTSILLVVIGITGMLTQKAVIKQVISMKVMLQGVALALIHTGKLNQDIRLAQALTLSAVIVETVIIALFFVLAALIMASLSMTSAMYARLRIDQYARLGWKWLVPLSLLQAAFVVWMGSGY